MEKTDILILGAGPAGLAAGFELHRAGKLFTIIEKNEEIGGISRTLQFNGFKTDIGPHRFFSQNQYLINLISSLLGDHWTKVNRLTRFLMKGKFFFYPIDFKNVLLNLGILRGIKVFKDYLQEKIKNILSKSVVVSFEDIVIAEFGRSLAELNMLNYTEKIWGISCSSISPDWFTQRIKGLSINSIVKNMIFKSTNSPKTLVDQFYYPDLGSSLIYDSMSDEILSGKNGIIKKSSKPSEIIHNNQKLLEIIINENGTDQLYKPSEVISSLPWNILLSIFKPEPPKKVLLALNKLKFRSYLSLFITLNKSQVFPDQWIYFPEKEIPFGRIMEPKNFSKKLSPIDKTSLLVEFFCWENDKIWNMNKEKLLNLTVRLLEKFGFIEKKEVIDSLIHREKFAYPVYDLFYKKYRDIVKNYLDQFQNLQLIGRAGNFRYNNQDHALEMGILAARNIIEGRKYDLETIGVEQQYFERGYIT